MVHQYKNNGYNIVLDVNSGAIHVVDDVTYDVIEMFEEHSAKEIIEKLEEKIAELDGQISKCATDFIKLNEFMQEKEKTEAKLSDKMERWVYLNDLAERIEEQKKEKRE